MVCLLAPYPFQDHIARKDQRRMRQRGIVIARLELVAEPEQGLRRLEEGFDAPTVPIEADRLIVGKDEVGGEQVQEFALLVPVPDEDDADRHFVLPSLYQQGAVRRSCIPTHRQFCQLRQCEESPLVQIPLIAVPDHADHMEPYVAEFLDKRVVREPTVHQDVIRFNARSQGTLDHEKRGFRILEHAAHPRLPAVRPTVNSLPGLLVTVLLLCRREQIECHGNEAEAVCPAEGQQVETAQISMGHMVVDPCEEFHGLASIPGEDGIVQHEHLLAAGAGQGTEYFRDPDCQEEQEAMPVEGRIFEEAVEGILGNGAAVMLCMQEPEQVLPMKDEQNQNMEKLKNRNPACLADICLTKQTPNLEFFHGQLDLIGRLVKCVRLW